MPRPSSQAVAQISKPLSTVMPVRAPRRRGRRRAQAAVVGVAQPTVVGAEEAAALPKKQSAAPYFAVAAVLVAAAAGAVVLRDAHAGATETATTQPPAIVTPAAGGGGDAAAGEGGPIRRRRRPSSEVIVDSVPPGAKIFVDGVAVADTPEAVKVDSGQDASSSCSRRTASSTRRRRSIRQKTHKVLVRLERVKKAARAGQGLRKPATKLPTPPSPTTDPPVKASPPSWRSAGAQPAPAQPPHKKKVVDPYERVDDIRPRSRRDVLNPY